MELTLDTLIGKKVALVAYSNDINIQYDSNGWTESRNCTFLKFKLDGDTYIMKIMEDGNDGYRSSFGGAEFVDESDEDYQKVVFNNLPPAKVTLKYDPDRVADNDGWTRRSENYEFIDDIGTIWFTFGTDNSDDYYPSYFCYANQVDLQSYREAVIGDVLDDE